MRKPRAIAFVVGYFVAVMFVRTIHWGFDNRARWAMNGIFPGMVFEFHTFGSISAAITFGVLLAVCLWLFARSILRSKPSATRAYLWYFCKIDYSFLVLFCAVGFVAGGMTIRMIPWWFAFVNVSFVLLTFMAYSLAMLAFGELFARIRDKTLLPTLYWVSFFKAFPVWHFVGFFGLTMLIIQLVLLVWQFFNPLRLLAIATIGGLTYFVAFLVNIGTKYSAANEEKIRAERFKSELITNVSHDIKTPLTSIINYVDLLKNENMQGKPAEYVHVIERKSSRLKSLIDDLMEASKAGTGNIQVNMQKISLSEIIGQAAGEFEDEFNEKNLTLVLNSPNEPVFIQADSRHLYRTLENLFSNCAKYALSGTRAFAEITNQNGATLLIFQNTAATPIEISGEDLTQQFIRGDKSRQTDGNGLGLYIAKSLIELMNGKLHVEIIGDLFRVVIKF